MTARSLAGTGALVVLAALTGAGCIGDFIATPPPEAEIRGRVDDVPEDLKNRAGGAVLKAQAVSVDGAVIAEVDTKVGESFSLKLGPGLSFSNVRVVVLGGAVSLKDFVPEAPAGKVIDLVEAHGPLGTETTASAQVAERYAVRERASLSSTPPGTLAAVLEKARGSNDAVTAFRALIADVLAVADPQADAPALDPVSSAADTGALELAGATQGEYAAALEAAVDASLVPIVCDPSQALVLFTVDTSGQAKDGNGAPQSIRQPVKEGKVFVGVTVDPSSPVADARGTLRPRLTPNDPRTEMRDDGTSGDEVAGDQVFSLTLPLPRGMRVLYKYTNGSPNEGFTGTEEWPGNARILEVEDVLTSSQSGQPDCLVVRRDSFGDEASNKNFVNLNARLGGGDLGYDDDLGGAELPLAQDGLLPNAGLRVEDLRTAAPLTPDGVPEARENGVCATCPAPLTVSADDDDPPRLVSAAFLSTDETRVAFSEDVDVASAGELSHYLLLDDNNDPIALFGARVTGAEVVLSHASVDPRDAFTLAVKDVTDASLDQNVIEDGAELRVGPDFAPPKVLEVKAGSIVDVNPAARPVDPSTGEVVIVTFSEVLDRISAENVAFYDVDGLTVHAAFQRGREVLLVTSQQTPNASYALTLGQVFDVSGNVMARASAIDFRGLSLVEVTFRALVDFAWLSVDGADRGLPAGDGLYVTGTVMRDARAQDGGDLRVTSRTDVAGVDGFEMLPTGELIDGADVYALTVRLPAGTYAYKLAHGAAVDAVDPPVSLETVSKGLATRNDGGGVAVDPITMRGRDGADYSGARVSLGGLELPGPGIVFKRENPDTIVTVGAAALTLPVDVIGTWRDVPFGPGADYDDGLTELPLSRAGEQDTEAPRLLSARARDSESVLLSFDEAVSVPAALGALVQGEEGELPVVETFVGQPLPTQIVVRTGQMQNDGAYSIAISGFADALGHIAGSPVTAGFSAPSAFQPFTPIVDNVPPTVVSVRGSSPTELTVTFSERVRDDAGQASHYNVPGLSITGSRLAAGGLSAVLTTETQGLQQPYSITVSGISDIAGNGMPTQTIDFVGFGELVAPEIAQAFAISPTQVALIWNEPVTADSAGALTSYLVSEVSVTAVRFGASDEARNAAFNATYAPLRADIVVLTTTPMTGGGSYTVDVEGVQDLSGNESSTQATFVAVSSAPLVDVILTYQISDTAGVVGVGPGGSAGVPSRALSPSTLAQQREGVFVLGTALTSSGAAPVADHPFTDALGGFPADGAPLVGEELELLDNGSSGDQTAGDNVYSVRVSGVPLGSTLAWKAFASMTTSYASSNPEHPLAGFADAPAGPSAFNDGQEYPGNDNAVFVVADADGDGVVRIECLFGDEITFKRKTGFPAFHFAVDRARRIE